MSDPLTLGLLIAVGLILVVVVSLLFSSTPDRHRPAPGAAQGFHLLLLGRNDEARRVLTECIQRGDAPPEAYLRLGDLLRDGGQAARALALHQGLLARPSLDPELRRLAELSLADDLLALDRPEEAVERLAQLDAQVLDEALRERYAQALHRTGRVEDAADVLLKRAKDDPATRGDAARYLAELAREALRSGKLETALSRAKRARQQDPDLATSYAVEGDALRQRDRHEEALEVWRLGFERGGAARDALLPRMVEAAFSIGKMEWLLEELESMLDRHPQDTGLWRAVTNLRLRRGDLETFFARVESPPAPDAIDLPTSSGWLRHLGAMDDATPFRRLLGHLPDSFGPQAWRCLRCRATDPEPREVCMSCGSLEDLVPAAGPGAGRALLATGDPQ